MESNKSVRRVEGNGLKDCPLCMETLEVDDLDFFPCSCKYQVCRFCWNRIITSENGLCPACRRAYNSEEPDSFKPVTNISTKQLKRKQKAKNTPADDPRKDLSDKRVVQPNLLFIANLPSTIPTDEDILKSDEYFGKYGVVLKAVVTHSANPSSSAPSVNSSANGSTSSNFTSAYITYRDKRDAMIALLDLQKGGFHGQRSSKVSLGTTKYCAQFLKGAPCGKKECMYLHQRGDDRASFTKEEMASGRHTQYEQQLMEDFLRELDTNLLPKGHCLAPKAAPKPLMECDDTVLIGSLRPLDVLDSSTGDGAAAMAPTPCSVTIKTATVRPQAKPVSHLPLNQTAPPAASSRKPTPIKVTAAVTSTPTKSTPVPSASKEKPIQATEPLSTATESKASSSIASTDGIPSASPSDVASSTSPPAAPQAPSDDEHSWLLDIVSENLSCLNQLALEEQLHTQTNNEDAEHFNSSYGPPPGFEDFQHQPSLLPTYTGEYSQRSQAQQWYSNTRPQSSSSTQQCYGGPVSRSPCTTSRDQACFYTPDSNGASVSMPHELNDVLKAVLPSSSTLRFGAAESVEQAHQTMSSMNHAQSYQNGTSNYYRTAVSQQNNWNGYVYPATTNSSTGYPNSKALPPNGTYWNSSNGMSMFHAGGNLNHSWSHDMYSNGGHDTSLHNLQSSAYHSAYMNGTEGAYSVSPFEGGHARYPGSVGPSDYQHPLNLQSRSFATASHGHGTYS